MGAGVVPSSHNPPGLEESGEMQVTVGRLVRLSSFAVADVGKVLQNCCESEWVHEGRRLTGGGELEFVGE